MLQSFYKFFRDEEGASAVEYGLIVGLIAVALIAVLLVLGGDQGLGGLFQQVADCVTSPSACGTAT